MEGYHVENFGCRASQADGDALSADLSQHRRPATAAEAAVVVLNTCAVTAEAESTARAYLRRVKRENPDARVIVTGCYAQRAPQEIARLAGVDAVVGNSHKALVPQVVAAALDAGPPRLQSPDNFQSPAKPPTSTEGFLPLGAITSHHGVPILIDTQFAHANLAADDLAASADTRPNLKVQDGCSNRCSFCVIPATRGHSRSLELASVLERVRRFADAGGNELVLSGINLGRWGRDLDPSGRFEDLVAAILCQTGLPRLRISSVEPMDWSDDLLALYRQYGREDAAPAGPRLARHAHLPLQSGADAILRAMHRRYRPWHYAERLAAIRETMPEAAIGADVMVGFPGETDALFEESYRFIEQQPFTYLHLFPFSARPGTAAWALAKENPVPEIAVRKRMAQLRTLIAGKQADFRERARRGRLPVITLKASADHSGRRVTPALSDTFLPVELYGAIPANRMLWTYVSCSGGFGSSGNAKALPVIPF